MAKIQSFAKFSALVKEKQNIDKNKKEELNSNLVSSNITDIPFNPNLPKEDENDIKHKPLKDDKLYPKNNVEDIPSETDTNDVNSKLETEFKATKESVDVEVYGKVCKIKNFDYNVVEHLENIKIPRNSLWYVLVEKQNNELQMIKYNNALKLDVSKFVCDLKEYYIKKFSNNESVKTLIESIQIGGDNNFSYIKNIPDISVEDNKKMISKITNDLIKLLSK